MTSDPIPTAGLAPEPAAPASNVIPFRRRPVPGTPAEEEPFVATDADTAAAWFAHMRSQVQAAIDAGRPR